MPIWVGNGLKRKWALFWIQSSRHFEKRSRDHGCISLPAQGAPEFAGKADESQGLGTDNIPLAGCLLLTRGENISRRIPVPVTETSWGGSPAWEFGVAQGQEHLSVVASAGSAWSWRWDGAGRWEKHPERLSSPPPSFCLKFQKSLSHSLCSSPLWRTWGRGSDRKSGLLRSRPLLRSAGWPGGNSLVRTLVLGRQSAPLPKRTFPRLPGEGEPSRGGHEMLGHIAHIHKTGQVHFQRF